MCKRFGLQSRAIGRCGKFKRWDLMEGLLVIEGLALKGIMEAQPFPLSLVLLSDHDIGSFACVAALM